jgi:membrane protein DedA with SNARE-associated domain
MARAATALEARALRTVFFSRWLVSALGPYVNAAAGATRLNWRIFTLAGVAGEAVWVSAYVGLGVMFASRIDDLGASLSSLTGALAAGLVALILGRVLLSLARERHEKHGLVDKSSDIA